jgi:hypothetical protein
MPGLNLSSDVQILPCHHCGQTINTSMSQCPFCGAAVDPGAALASAELFAKVNQAISDASYLKIMAGSAITFFVLRLVPFLGLVGIVGFWFLEFAVPFMLVRWWVRYGNLKSPDAEFVRAKRTSMYVGAGALAFFILADLGILLL